MTLFRLCLCFSFLCHSDDRKNLFSFPQHKQRCFVSLNMTRTLHDTRQKNVIGSNAKGDMRNDISLYILLFARARETLRWSENLYQVAGKGTTCGGRGMASEGKRRQKTQRSCIRNSCRLLPYMVCSPSPSRFWFR